MEKPYHKFVFDKEKREFVGRFDEMYRQEDIEHFDSWEQEKYDHLARHLALAVLGRFHFSSVLDFGCGKGYFTRLLKEDENIVKGVDISPYVIDKAKKLFPGIEFEVSSEEQFIVDKSNYDLVVVMEVLSYLKNWKEFIRAVSGKTKWMFLTLYLPEKPIGFIKSFDGLKEVVKKYFDTETELLINNEQLLLLLKAKS
jgi:SAM-dependent methyltransferase